MKNTLKTLLPDNIQRDVAFQGKVPVLISKIKQSFRINLIWFAMVNFPKKVVMMTMSAKQQNASLKR